MTTTEEKEITLLCYYLSGLDGYHWQQSPFFSGMIKKSDDMMNIVEFAPLHNTNQALDLARKHKAPVKGWLPVAELRESICRFVAALV